MFHPHKATKYLLDPLTAPEPFQEDGPGNTFRPGATVAPVKSSAPQSPPGRRLSKTNPYRKSSGAPATSEVRRSVSLSSSNNKTAAYPSPPPSANSPSGKYPLQSPVNLNSSNSPRSPSHRQEAFGENKPGRRRTSSLGERYPGDMSHRPLDTLVKEKHTADRARHMTRKHHIRPDTIDSLDNSGLGSYHHGGPYDATLYARNNTVNSPLAALKDSNDEALRATPKEKIIDSVQHHRPLDGVAAYAPGSYDRNGRLYTYEEGDNMMMDSNAAGGAYKRWPGVQYHPDDIKGKGEPSYSIEKALKESKIRDEKIAPDGIEMKTNPRDHQGGHSREPSGSGAIATTGWDDGEARVNRSSSMSKRLSGGLKKRFGSIKKSNKATD